MMQMSQELGHDMSGTTSTKVLHFQTKRKEEQKFYNSKLKARNDKRRGKKRVRVTLVHRISIDKM